ncbi:TetR/AcrR family transcriptional regulator [Actinokineospora bangkokensis]|uniref:TetR family transcriptional regulator n=1 Tax=Actinokineospora bangkokensis TaxID=1193682 RepID=A0A1Q9LP42_9PSEU|nr:TetR/AcrR family transcriptional regulator [Actinokineospora bangkokensis]OLR93817.1 TetR family transcriptional regulator [Actinokineospora bangkokensis]
MSAPGSRLRADARDNRERIIAAARETFTERGLDTPMATIARRAGVGAATLYRRFPTKSDLVAAAFAERMTACAVIAENGLADPDPWQGFATAVTRLAGMRTLDRGLTAALLRAYPDVLDFTTHRARALRATAELITRAQRSGGLRADFTLDDVLMLLMANNGLVSDNPATATAATRRLVAWFLAGARSDHPMPPPVPLAATEVLRPRPATDL